MTVLRLADDDVLQRIRASFALSADSFLRFENGILGSSLDSLFLLDGKSAGLIRTDNASPAARLGDAMFYRRMNSVGVLRWRDGSVLWEKPFSPELPLFYWEIHAN